MNILKIRHLACAAALASCAGLANADLVALIDGNDCSGVFGQGFDNCKIPAQYDPNESPVIIKFAPNANGGLSVDAINSLFPSIDGSEFSFSNLGAGLGTGTWTYTPGAGDPGINWFVAKAANNFNLFSNLGDPLSDAWITPLNQQGEPRDLSHITFYDTASSSSSSSSSSGIGSGNVPEPGSSGLAIVGMGLLAATLWLRRRSDKT